MPGVHFVLIVFLASIGTSDFEVGLWDSDESVHLLWERSRDLGGCDHLEVAQPLEFGQGG